MTVADATYRANLCLAGNDRGGNAGLTPDVYDRPESDPLSRAPIYATAAGEVGVFIGVYFTCASEATPPVSFPCTGSKHPARGIEVICTCACHVVRDRIVRTPADPSEGTC